MSQLVIIQSIEDEFDLINNNPVILLLAQHITKRGEEQELISKEIQRTYHSGVGKMLYVL